ncbi:unnamed protein product, partial [marine sediment metagenome]
MGLMVALACLPWGAYGEAPSAADIEFFERAVRPVLAENCFKCHGPEKQKAGLRLDHIASILEGSDSGKVVVPGAPESSLLVEAIGYANVDLQMPPKKGKLSDAAIADLTRWVAMGAPWPEEAVAQTAAAEAAFDLAERRASHWAWQALA